MVLSFPWGVAHGAVDRESTDNSRALSSAALVAASESAVTTDAVLVKFFSCNKESPMHLLALLVPADGAACRLPLSVGLVQGVPEEEEERCC